MDKLNIQKLKTKYSRLEIKSDINITPFVDVLLILLLVFMVTAPTLESGFEVNLPKASNVENIKQEDVNVNIIISKDGAYYINNKKVSFNSIDTNLKEIEPQAAKIFIKADESVKYNLVINLINKLTLLGFSNVSLIAESQ
jgi:biopolymer transport protein TolR